MRDACTALGKCMLIYAPPLAPTHVRDGHTRTRTCCSSPRPSSPSAHSTSAVPGAVGGHGSLACGWSWSWSWSCCCCCCSCCRAECGNREADPLEGVAAVCGAPALLEPRPSGAGISAAPSSSTCNG